MKKPLMPLILIIFLSGCALTPEKIVKNPQKAIENCNKIENMDERNECFSSIALNAGILSKGTGVMLCTQIESNYQRNKCLFDMFTELEKNNRIEEAIDVCKQINKEGYSEWCESRRNRDSISVAPSLA